ncbi:MAG TPA: peptide chain release factor N(5)-glutamine methyltransferase [Pyrinomonadaceae bacterium]
MKISIATALLEASQFLRKGDVPEARREAGSLLAHVIDKDRTFLISHAEDLLTEEDFHRFREIVKRRAAGEPLQYITGRQDFYGREFRVSPAVLIPRPETELLVESALEVLTDDARFCDVGTGSGCIAITLLCERPSTRGVGVDISDPALRIAKQNAEALGVADRLTLVRSDCFDSLLDETFDMIVSNPPYVSADVIPGLQREVKDHEPMVALTPGSDGLSIIRRLLDEAPRHLRKDGFMFLEIGFDQGDAVRELVNADVWELIDIKPDLQGIPRIVVLKNVKRD